MKWLFVALCAFIFGVGILAIPSGDREPSRLLGAKQCTWGPSYWCANLTNAHNCNAVRHCIQTVWEKQSPKGDNDSICKICLDMVKQARDQLESNETQEELREVFEGSCRLIPLKTIRKECIKLADNFIPELVEALASEMNPEVVCSTAGLCNNAAIDKMLEDEALHKTEESDSSEESKEHAVEGKLSCSSCGSVATIITNKFKASDRDAILDNMLHACGKMSSFSDACSNIVLTYFNDIYGELTARLTADNICHLSGVCSNQYHQHPELVEIRPLSDVGYVAVKDDIPCELCEQLIKHLRDVLIANTTEAEFKEVLEGICNQTGKFKSECQSIVDQYYDEIYHALVNNLDANGACYMIGVCPKGLGSEEAKNMPIMPLLPVLEPQEIKITMKEIKKAPAPERKLLGQNEPKYTQDEILSMQLPIDRLIGAPLPNQLLHNGELCTICEYFLHYVQEALATPSNAEKIKKVVGSTCERLPQSVRSECHNFVDMYGDQVIALLIQQMDPREICPLLKLCPGNVDDMEVFAPQPIEVSINAHPSEDDKPQCPFCLFAVKQAQEMVKSDKTKQNIRRALDNLCSHLQPKLRLECTDFVDTYSDILIEKLVGDFTPQQICVDIKLCDDNKFRLSDINVYVSSEEDEDIMTNEISDNTYNGREIVTNKYASGSLPECKLCEMIVKEVEKNIVNKKSKEQIKHALEHACEKLHAFKNKCESFIEKHGDQIVDLFMQQLAPHQMCRILELCESNIEDLDIDEALHVSVIAIPSERITGLDDIVKVDSSIEDAPNDDLPCVVCEFVMAKLEKELRNKTTQDEIKHTVETICTKMPKTIAKTCKKFVDQYGDLVINLIDTVPPKEICQKISVCAQLHLEITDEVIECGVCHGTAAAVNNVLKESNEEHEVDYITERSCDTLPAKYTQKCIDLMEYYAPSIINLLKAKTQVSQVCAMIGMCFEEENSRLDFVSLTSGGGNRPPAWLKPIRGSD